MLLCIHLLEPLSGSVGGARAEPLHNELHKRLLGGEARTQPESSDRLGLVDVGLVLRIGEAPALLTHHQLLLLLLLLLLLHLRLHLHLHLHLHLLHLHLLLVLHQ